MPGSWVPVLRHADNAMPQQQVLLSMREVPLILWSVWLGALLR